MIRLILGPPGTGKTTKLLSLVEQELSSGVLPEEICYVSFTKRAVKEAVERAAKKLCLPEKHFRLFKTLHALSFYMLGMRAEQVMQIEDYRDFGRQIGVTITGVQRQDLSTFEMAEGDQMVFIDGLSRLTMRDLRETWSEQESTITWEEMHYFSSGLAAYKKEHLLSDYTDMLERYYQCGVPPKIKTLFVDEAQDLCLLQWKIIERICGAAEKTIIAGDDDQAIYRWSGAAVDYFFDLTKKHDAEILDKSYRLPVAVKTFADSIIQKVSDRKDKQFSSREEQGCVDRIASIDSLNMTKGRWLILVRNNIFIRELLDFLRASGLLYASVYGDVRDEPGVKAALSWEKKRRGQALSKAEERYVERYVSSTMPASAPWFDALDLMPLIDKEYYRACRRNGESFTEEPRIFVNTIHGSKGSECENVVVFTDMTNRTFEGYLKNSDDECRVYYVAFTRAKNNLFIVEPQTHLHFEV